MDLVTRGARAGFMVIGIRHGETDWNAKGIGGGDKAEIVRGNIDVPLNANGQLKVLQAAHDICQYPVHEVRSTPNYLRATQTRHIIAQVCGVPEVDEPKLDPWDVGDLSGKSVAAIWAILSFLMDIPFIPAPGGESHDAYRVEFENYFRQVYSEYGNDDSRAVVVVLFGDEFHLLPIEKHVHHSVKPGEFVVMH